LPKKTVALIVEKQGGYLLKVKANQKTLFEQVQQQCQQERCLESFTTLEQSRGRLERRTVELYDKPAAASAQWVDLQLVLKVTRSGERKQEPYYREGYYISNLLEGACDFSGLLRGQWHIENQLHWTKDVVFGEDKSKINQENAPGNFSIIRGFVIGRFHQKGYANITQQQRLWANKPQHWIQLLE
jgi:predicted transposase YbfD/YdcC